MTQTGTKAEVLERQYATIIESLIADAVRPPLELFQQSAGARLDVSAKAIADAGTVLVKQAERIGGDLRQQLQAFVDPVRDSVEQLVEQIGRLEILVQRSSAEAAAVTIRADLAGLVAETQRLSANVGQKLDEVRIEGTRLAEDAAQRSDEVAESIVHDLEAVKQMASARLEAIFIAVNTVESQITNRSQAATADLKVEIGRSRVATEHALKKLDSDFKDEISRKAKEVRGAGEEVQKQLRAIRTEVEGIRVQIEHVIGQTRAGVEGKLVDVGAQLTILIDHHAEAARTEAEQMRKETASWTETRLVAIRQQLMQRAQQTEELVGRLAVQTAADAERSRAERSAVLRQITIVKRFVITLTVFWGGVMLVIVVSAIT